MLELHRLNNHKVMNFWRLSNSLRFSDFSAGDLVFFLSKDKEHMNRREKGIVGFGRLRYVHLDTVKNVWDTYEQFNGYNTIEEFKEAIIKVSKTKKLPKKISGLYLENVTFFQPIYLSELGVKISSSVESYIYLEDEITDGLLKLAAESKDLWSAFSENSKAIATEEILRELFKAHKKIGSIQSNEKILKRVNKKFPEYLAKGYSLMNDCDNELYRYGEGKIEIVFYHDKYADDKALIGQARLYRYYLNGLKEKGIRISFSLTDHTDTLEYLMNN